MIALPEPPRRRSLFDRLRLWRTDRIADPAFQSWALSFPLTRPIVARKSAQLYDLVAGFVYSQVLAAAVALDLPDRLARAPARAEALALRDGLDPDRLDRLLGAGCALGLFSRLSDGRYALADLGAALRGAPGVVEMIRHHRLFYADLADPVALLRGDRQTELSRYYSYAGGRNTHGMSAEEAAPYSALMSASQDMVIAETLRAAPLAGVSHLMDVGGGEGRFALAAAMADSRLSVTLFDLPAVADRARARFAEAGLGARARAIGGSFHDGVLPDGADAVSLVRVLYDHDDAAVRALLAAARAALPKGGRIVISEPMSGGTRPNREGDVYFAFYTLAMSSGRARSPDRIGALLAEAGFRRIRTARTRQRFITQVVSATAA